MMNKNFLKIKLAPVLVRELHHPAPIFHGYEESENKILAFNPD
jgi:hypothetical protein